MKKKSVYFVIITLMVLGNPLIVFSNDECVHDTVLVFDPPGFLTNQAGVNSSYEIKPKKNDFEIVDSAFMSNKIGERWAVATIKNLASGRRSLRPDHIVATLANESQCRARNVNETFKGGEMLTVSIFMGIHKFPIVRIQSQ